MEFFEGVASVRLKAIHKKFLWADDDKSVFQQSTGDKATVWKVEVGAGTNTIRLRSVYELYLTSSDFAFLLGLTGKKVHQTYATKADSAVEWEPIREGNLVKLKTKRGTFLRANGGFPPYRNSVTHDVPKNASTQNWILWEVHIVDQRTPIEESFIRLPTPSKDRVARSPHVSLSPYASVSPELESPKRPYRSDSEEVSEDEEIPIVSTTKLSNSSKDKEQLSLKKPFQSDDEESSEDASIASHLSNRSKQNEVVPQRGHQGPSYDSERRPMAMQLPSRSEQQEEEESGTEEGVVDSENDEGPPWSEMQKQHVSKQKEHPAPRRTYRTSIERQHSQRNLPVSPRQHHNVSYDNAERRARLPQSPPDRQHSSNDGSEHAPRRHKNQTLNDEEQIAPKIRHPPTRRHQSSSDEREKILRITQSPPRRDGRSQRREGREGTSQSSLRRGERYAEESERRGRNLVQSPPRTPRRSDMSPEEREQRRGGAVSPPRRNQRLREEREERESIRGSQSRRKQRVPDDREHRRRPVYDSSERGDESSSDEREHVSRGGRSPPRREPRFNERGDSRRKVQSPPREEDHDDTTLNPWARQPTPIVNHISFDDSRVSSRRSSSRMSSQISSDVRRIFFAVADDNGESAGVDDGDWGSFLLEGKTLEDLKEALQEQTGIYEDIFVCVRSPLSGKLNMLKQNLPPTNSPLQVELVIVNSTAGRNLARPQSVRTRYSTENSSDIESVYGTN